MGNRSAQAVRDFWHHVKRLKPWKSHPIWDLVEGQDLKDVCGVTIHVHGAEFYSDDEFFVYSMSSVFAGTSLISDVLLYKFPLAIFAERDMDNEALHLCHFPCSPPCKRIPTSQ